MKYGIFLCDFLNSICRHVTVIFLLPYHLIYKLYIYLLRFSCFLTNKYSREKFYLFEKTRSIKLQSKRRMRKFSDKYLCSFGTIQYSFKLDDLLDFLSSMSLSPSIHSVSEYLSRKTCDKLVKKCQSTRKLFHSN